MSLVIHDLELTAKATLRRLYPVSNKKLIYFPNEQYIQHLIHNQFTVGLFKRIPYANTKSQKSRTENPVN